ncbi:MAG TPA: hypothetical protein VK480_09830 [Solirubrobacterales bacterium]|nr:hypothetical protein [Solirubrobacterales bacterium]
MRRNLVLLAISAIVALIIPAGAHATALARLSPATQSLARCVQTNGRLSVLMLIDESGSLASTDPFNQRVDGIRAALTGLADLSEVPVDGRKPEVSVLMAGFFGLVRPDPEEGVPEGAWKPVSGENVDELLEDAGRYEALNRGRSTDYATALTAARKLLADRAAEQTQEGGAPCQALIWFTDGRYSLPRRVGKSGVGLPLTLPYAPGIRLDEPGAGEEAVTAGKNFMCKPNGLMDRLQSDGVIRFTVALSTDLSAADAAFLDAATTGSGGDGQRCGAHLSPLSGEYLSASNGDRLFFAFASLGGATVPVHAKPICPKLSCVRGVTSFTTVPGLSRFLIKASGGAQRSKTPRTLYLQLDGPDGQSVTLKPDGPVTFSLAGATITQRWVSSRAVEVQGDLAPGGRDWLGHWSYAFVDPAASPGAPGGRGYSAVQLFADLEPAPQGSPVLIRGSPTKLGFELRQGSNPDQPVTAGALVRSAHLFATIDDPISGSSTRVPVTGPDSDGTFSAKVAIPSTSTAGFVYLGLTASFSTPGGTPIAPQYRSFDVPVRFPPGQGFPTISPSTLDLPSLHGVGETEGILTVKASSVASGCVWLGPAEVENAPSGAGKVVATVTPEAGSADRCISLGKGEERRFTVRLKPSSEARGTVTASIPVHLRSDLVETEHVVSVPVAFAMARAPGVGTVALTVVLILLGVLLPLLLLHLLNGFGAWFAAPNRLRAIRLPVEMAHGGPLRRRDEGSEIGRGESLHVQGERRVRELEVGGLEFETVASGSVKDRTFELFRGPYGIVRSKGRKLIAGAKQPLRSWRDGTAHQVPLGLAGTWIFRFDALRPAESGREEAAVTAPGAARQEGNFFAPSEPPVVESSARPKPREARIEGELVLLISDGPPLDQGERLFEQAEEGLKAVDSLWEEARPEPEPEPEPEAAPAPSDDEGDGFREPEEAPGPPIPPAPEPKGWTPAPGPAKKPGRKPGKGGDDNFF